VRLDHLWLTDFRNYRAVELGLPPGLLAVVGDNGAGKTNLLEAIGYLATLASFRGVGNEALVRAGAGQAVVRGEGERQGRALLIEAEIRPSGRGRVTVNRQPLRRSADLAATLRVSVFSPDDLELVKAGPTGRRRYLDDALSSLHPRHAAARRDFERVLRQRNALLQQAGLRGPNAVAGLRGPNAAPGLRGPNAGPGLRGPNAGPGLRGPNAGPGLRGPNAVTGLPEDVATTLGVWDARMVETGEALGAARADLVARLEPAVTKAYAAMAGVGEATLAYEAPWRADGLARALELARRDELRRGVSLVGPHRDDLVLTVNGLPARTHASQGEQRSLALALRLAAHVVVGEAVGEPPFLLLDDVFSELDAGRSRALLDHLAATSFGHVAGGQAVLTTAESLPPGAEPDLIVRITAGTIG
jgi:DNA replication and repair protein RecF